MRASRPPVPLWGGGTVKLRRFRVAAVLAGLALLMGVSCKLGELIAPADWTQPPGSDGNTLPSSPDSVRSPGQFRADGVTPIPVGGTTDELTVIVKATLTDRDADDRLRLQVELRPVGVTFSGSPTGESDWVGNGARASVTFSGLQDETAYQWQARVMDQGGRTGPWVYYAGPSVSMVHFRVAVPPPPPPPPPQSQPPTAPTGLAQLKSDGATAIAVGGTTDETTMMLRGTLSDPDANDRLRFEVEVRAIGTAFSGSSTAASIEVTSGNTASLTVSGLIDGTSYHWQARTVDQGGRSSAWVSFGGNAESAADFSVAAPPPPQPPSVPSGLAQLKSDGTTVLAVGGTTDQTTVVLKGTLSDPDAGDQVRLEVEVRAVGTVFTGTATAQSALVTNGGTASVTVFGLADGSGYHWQARSADAGGRTSAWVAFGGNAESVADFRVAVPPPPPPTPQAPNVPSGLGQFKSDGATALAVGATTNETTVVLKGTLSDPDAGDTLRLEVEVRAVGTVFTGTATAQSALVTNGGTASVTVFGLADGSGYHWQARSADAGGRTSGWLAFGGNAESAADFSVAVPPPPPPPPQAPSAPSSLGQLKSDGTTTLAVGATTDETTVVLKGTLSDPDAGDTLRLEVEVRAVGTPFTGTATGASAALANGSTASVTVSGLTDQTSYHWQARTVDAGGGTSAWVAFGGNAESAADFSVAVPPPPPPPPQAPSAPSSLGQFKSDGTTAIAVGGTTHDTVVVLKGSVADPDVGARLRLQVEVVPTQTPFTGLVIATSGEVGSGERAEVRVEGLVRGATYHWRARTIDETGRTSAWSSFGGNSDGDTDFSVSLL